MRKNGIRLPVMGVYAIYCTNGHAYIGSSGDIEGRVRSHFYSLKSGIHHNSHLQRAYEKYGAEAFDWDIIEQCLINPWDREQWWIDFFQDLNPLFNMDSTAARAYPLSVPQETRDKIAKTITGQKRSQETRDRIREALVGKKHAPERNQHHSRVMKGRKNSASISALSASVAVRRVYVTDEQRELIIKLTDDRLSHRKIESQTGIAAHIVRRTLKESKR